MDIVSRVETNCPKFHELAGVSLEQLERSVAYGVPRYGKD